MQTYSRTYISDSTSDSSVIISSVKGVGTSAEENVKIQNFSFPLIQDMVIVGPSGTLLSGYEDVCSYNVSFYPFLITDVTFNGQPYFFDHPVANAGDIGSIRIEDNSGNKISTDLYKLLYKDGKYHCYHNLVNTNNSYYYVVYVKNQGNGIIDYAYRELLTSTQVMREVFPEYVNKVAADSSLYTMSITSDSIFINLKKDGTYYIYFDYQQLVFLSYNYSYDQNWYTSVRKFAYKEPVSGKVFSNFKMYDKEDFHPGIGVNFAFDYRNPSDGNRVLFTTAKPLFYTDLEYPILHTTAGRPLPVRSIDLYSGAVEIDADKETAEYGETDYYDLSYFMKQDFVLLDYSKMHPVKQKYPNFNPAFNNFCYGRLYVLYCSPYSSVGHVLYYAVFERRVVDGKEGLYLTSTAPNDSDIVAYCDGRTVDYDTFIVEFNISRNKTNPMAKLILGSVMVHNTKTTLDFSADNVFDQRELGGGIQLDQLSEAGEVNPETTYYWDFQPHEGDVAPAMKSVMVFVPTRVLTNFTASDIVSIVKKHSSVGLYPVVIEL